MQYYEEGLESIARGELGVIINSAGISASDSVSKPKVMHYPKWKLECSLLEYVLKN